MDGDGAEPRPARGRMRWGLLTLLFLGIALACLLVSNGQGRYTALTGLGLLVGLAGAGYCTFRGLKGFSWLPR